MDKEMIDRLYAMALKEGCVFGYTNPGDETRMIRVQVNGGKSVFTLQEFVLYLQHTMPSSANG